MARHCLHCTAPLLPVQQRGRPRRYCSDRCNWNAAHARRRKPVPTTCAYCGADASHRAVKDGRRTCSPLCTNRLAHGVVLVDRECPRCGTGFTCPERALKTYCTKDCQVANDRGADRRKERPCKHCGTTFLARPDHVYCTQPCRLAAFSAARKDQGRRNWPHTRIHFLACTHCARVFVRRRGGGGGGPAKPGGEVPRAYCGGECRRTGEALRLAALRPPRTCGDCAAPIGRSVTYCDTCRATRHAANRQRRKELERRLGLRQGQNNDRQRAKHYGVEYEPIRRRRVYDRDGWCCGIICRQPVDPALRYPDPMSASLDHVVPLSRGGPHTYANVQLAHLE